MEKKRFIWICSIVTVNFLYVKQFVTLNPKMSLPYSLYIQPCMYNNIYLLQLLALREKLLYLEHIHRALYYEYNVCILEQHMF